VIYVVTPTYRHFQQFMQEFRLREHFGNGDNKEGQVVAVTADNPDRIRGISRGIILLWAADGHRAHRYWLQFVDEIHYYARVHYMPVLNVPDLRQEAHYAEQRKPHRREF